MAEPQPGDAESFTLEIGSGPDAPAACRLFIGAVLRTVAAGEELVDDVKLVVSEAVTAIINAGRADAVRVVFEAATGRLTIGPLRHDELVRSAGEFELIGALFPNARLDEHETLVVDTDSPGRNPIS